jgi:hypothetical protein
MSPLEHWLQAMTHGDVHSVWGARAPSRAHNCGACGVACPSLPLAACLELHEKRHRLNPPLATQALSPGVSLRQGRDTIERGTVELYYTII